MVFISWSRKRAQPIPAKIIITCENDYRRRLFSQNTNRRCWTGFWISLGFWICQCSEYTKALNKPRFWMNMLGLWICFWCWIYEGSGHATVNMPRLHRVLNMPKYVWTIHEYVWLCLNILNLPEWLLFYIYAL